MEINLAGSEGKLPQSSRKGLKGWGGEGDEHLNEDGPALFLK